MELAFELLSLLVQLAIIGLIIWAIVRAVGRRRGESGGGDQASSIRRLFVYGLLFTTLVLSAQGVVTVLQELVRAASDGIGDDRSTIALGLAFVVVTGPAYALLLRHARHHLDASDAERRSFSWACYLNLSLVVSLIITTVTARRMLEGVTGVEDVEPGSVVPVAIWGAVWALHWFWLKAAYGLPGDLHLAAGSLTGLVTLAIGLGGIVFVAGDEIYTSLVDEVREGRYESDLRTWLIAAALGAIVWGWHWLARYRRAERTEVWHAYVLLIGVLGSLVATIAAAATIADWTLVWFLGDPSETLPSEHFQWVSAAGAVLVVGAVTWQYHRLVLQRGRTVERSEALRAYDYLLAGAGMVAFVVGVTLALVAFIDAITPEGAGEETQVANRLILAAILSAIGGPLWWAAWSRICRLTAADPSPELGSIVRRSYLIVVFGVGGIVAMVSLINVLFLGFEALLEGSFGGATVRSFRVGLSLVVTVAGVAWYHLRVYRSDRDTIRVAAPALLAHPARHVVLIAPPDRDLAEDLAAATGAKLDGWCRTDDAVMPDIDVEALAARIEAAEAQDVLVVVGSDGSTVVPFEPRSSRHP